MERLLFDINFRLQGREYICPAVTTASDPQEAIENFLNDYSPSIGRIVWIEVVTDDASASRNKKAYDFVRSRRHSLRPNSDSGVIG
jgi:hypothetical protein